MMTIYIIMLPEPEMSIEDLEPFALVKGGDIDSVGKESANYFDDPPAPKVVESSSSPLPALKPSNTYQAMIASLKTAAAITKDAMGDPLIGEEEAEQVFEESLIAFYAQYFSEVSDLDDPMSKELVQKSVTNLERTERNRIRLTPIAHMHKKRQGSQRRELRIRLIRRVPRESSKIR
jgi:hypothetical protein